MTTYTSVKEFNQMWQTKCLIRPLSCTLLMSFSAIKILLSDTCSYIDRLGSVDSRRPRNYPLEAGAKFNPLSLFTSVGLRFMPSRSSPRAKNFLPIEETRLRYTSSVYFQRTLKAALISSYMKQHCVKTGTIIMSYHKLMFRCIVFYQKNTFTRTLQFIKLT